MQQLIFKSPISASKMKALILFLKSWGIDAEFKQVPKLKSSQENDNGFNLSVGLWGDYDINSKELRKKHGINHQ
jgi:hypothetical protein